MDGDSFDLIVIGGGINGAGIAADAAGRGLSVALFEAGDLGGATSSASSKLIHGGLRYLEQRAFRLVREALGEREVLLGVAPHIIWPMRFVLPHVDGMRSRALLSAGLFLYDHMSTRRSLPASKRLDLSSEPAGRPLLRELTHGFAYWDCWVDDARLVVLNAMAARNSGAAIHTRTPVTSAVCSDGAWLVTTGHGANARTHRAKALVNAAGPWADRVAGLMRGGRNEPSLALRLVKGSHIVVPRVAGADDAYIFQSGDGRVVFALPFEHEFTLIGTTDVHFEGDPGSAAISPEETAYLLDVAQQFFATPLSAADIVWTFAGVRPLDDDGASRASAVSRDYRLDLDQSAGAPVLHVIGGKITTYRRLAEQAIDQLTGVFPRLGSAKTRTAILPGGDVGPAGFASWFDDLCRRRSGFERPALLRLARRYGTRTDLILNSARTPAELGADLGAGLTAREIAYLKAEEWAQTADDVLWRRTKAGLHVPSHERAAVADAVAATLSTC